MKFQYILTTFITLASSVNADTECDSALKILFTDLSDDYKKTGEIHVSPAPSVCHQQGVETDAKGVAEYKTNWNAFCTAQFGNYTRYTTGYSYLPMDSTVQFEENAAITGAEIFDDILSRNCASGAVFTSDGSETGGWNIWYEVINTTTDDVCTPAVFAGDLEASITANLVNSAQWEKSSFCTIIEPPAASSENTRILLRVLHNQETRFASPADVPCSVVNPGYRVETEKC